MYYTGLPPLGIEISSYYNSFLITWSGISTRGDLCKTRVIPITNEERQRDLKFYAVHYPFKGIDRSLV